MVRASSEDAERPLEIRRAYPGEPGGSRSAAGTTVYVGGVHAEPRCRAASIKRQAKERTVRLKQSVVSYPQLPPAPSETSRSVGLSAAYLVMVIGTTKKGSETVRNLRSPTGSSSSTTKQQCQVATTLSRLTGRKSSVVLLGGLYGVQETRHRMSIYRILNRVNP